MKGNQPRKSKKERDALRECHNLSLSLFFTHTHTRAMHENPFTYVTKMQVDSAHVHSNFHNRIGSRAQPKKENKKYASQGPRRKELLLSFCFFFLLIFFLIHQPHYFSNLKIDNITSVT